MVVPSVASRPFVGAPGARASKIRLDASHAAEEWRLVTQTGGARLKAELPLLNC
jgi:hypothetical protein